LDNAKKYCSVFDVAIVTRTWVPFDFDSYHLIMPEPIEHKSEVKEEKKCKPCCACPETKKARDEW
jgi:hypothetical protein